MAIEIACTVQKYKHLYISMCFLEKKCGIIFFYLRKNRNFMGI